MLLAQRDVDHLKDLLRDVKLGRLPLTLTPSVLFAFFTENPHLLMAEAFDEHMQCPIPDDDSAWFMQLATDPKTKDADFLEYHLPRLDFRTQGGRWSSLVGLPMPSDDPGDTELLSFAFSFAMRQVWSEFEKNRDRLSEDKWAPGTRPLQKHNLLRTVPNNLHTRPALLPPILTRDDICYQQHTIGTRNAY